LDKHLFLALESRVNFYFQNDEPTIGEAEKDSK